jgi:hypothetical protein
MERPDVFAFLHNLVGTVNSESESDGGNDSETDDHVSIIHSEDDEIHVDDDLAYEEEVYYSKNGKYLWKTLQPEQRGRKSMHNVVKHIEGPAPHVKPQSEIESLGYFLTDDILDEIVRCTNAEGERVMKQSWNYICKVELLGFIGILYLIGVLRGGKQRLRDYWDTLFGQNAIIATMSRDRFLEILRVLRFDIRTERPLKNDRLAPIRKVWEFFLGNCRRSIIPATYLCVDEQIVATRGRCPFRVYMSNKPHK